MFLEDKVIGNTLRLIFQEIETWKTTGPRLEIQRVVKVVLLSSKNKFTEGNMISSPFFFTLLIEHPSHTTKTSNEVCMN